MKEDWRANLVGGYRLNLKPTFPISFDSVYGSYAAQYLLPNIKLLDGQQQQSEYDDNNSNAIDTYNCEIIQNNRFVNIIERNRHVCG